MNPVVPVFKGRKCDLSRSESFLRTFCPFFVFLFVKYLCMSEMRLVIGYIYKKEDCDAFDLTNQDIVRPTVFGFLLDVPHTLICIFYLIRNNGIMRPRYLCRHCLHKCFIRISLREFWERLLSHFRLETSEDK